MIRLLRSDAAPLALAALWLACVAPFRSEVVSPDNLTDVARAALPLLVLAVGQLFVLVAGGIDLSAAAVVGLASVVGALAMTNATLGAATMLAVGTAVGLGHGLAVGVLRMPAFLVTMSSLVALGGVAVWLTHSQPVAGLPASYLTLAGWPGVAVAAAVCVVAHLLLARSLWGRQLRAVGWNAATARVSGVPVAARVAGAFAASGFCSGVAALLVTARLEAGSATALPREILLDVLGAAVIGGASLRGGRGSVAGVAAGVVVMALIGNGLIMLDLDYWHVVTAKGALIFLAAAFDAVRTRGGGVR